jgi:hypothetical protein
MQRTPYLLAAAFALTAGFAAQAAPAQPHPIPALVLHAPKSLVNQPKNTVVGTWAVSYDGGVHNTYTQWHKDGTVMEVADFPPKTGNNLIVGDWAANGDGSQSSYLVAYIWDDKGKNLANYFTKSETVTVSGDTYSGTFEVTYYDLDGNVVFQHDGTLTGTRIESH